MDYALSAEQFLYGKMFDSKGQFSHKTGNRFKLFPFVLTSGKDTKAIMDFIQYVEKTAEAEATEIIYDLPDQSLYTLNNLMKSGLNRTCNDVKKLITESQANQGKVDEIDSYLCVDGNGASRRTN